MFYVSTTYEKHYGKYLIRLVCSLPSDSTCIHICLILFSVNCTCNIVVYSDRWCLIDPKIFKLQVLAKRLCPFEPPSGHKFRRFFLYECARRFLCCIIRHYWSKLVRWCGYIHSWISVLSCIEYRACSQLFRRSAQFGSNVRGLLPLLSSNDIFL